MLKISAANTKIGSKHRCDEVSSSYKMFILYLIFSFQTMDVHRRKICATPTALHINTFERCTHYYYTTVNRMVCSRIERKAGFTLHRVVWFRIFMLIPKCNTNDIIWISYLMILFYSSHHFSAHKCNRTVKRWIHSTMRYRLVTTTVVTVIILHVTV